MEIRLDIVHIIDAAKLADSDLLTLHRELTEELLRRGKRSEEMVMAATKFKMGIAPDLTDEEKWLVRQNKRVAAIKAFRERMISMADNGTPGAEKFTGLKEAKDVVDAYANSGARIQDDHNDIRGSQTGRWQDEVIGFLDMHNKLHEAFEGQYSWANYDKDKKQWNTACDHVINRVLEDDDE